MFMENCGVNHTLPVSSPEIEYFNCKPYNSIYFYGKAIV